MPPRASPRPKAPRPQTQRCRFADDHYGRCRSIATVDGFCQRHAHELEEEVQHRSPLESLIESVGGWFGSGTGRRRRNEPMVDMDAVIADGIRAVTGMAADHIRQRAAAHQAPGVHGARAGQAPPRQRVAPEAIAARKANIAARGVMGFDPDEPLTEDMIKGRRRDLARVWHTDNAAAQKDPTREAMMRKINGAADLLLAAAGARPPR